MKHASLSLPEDLWQYLDATAARLHCSRASAAAHVIREHKDSKVLERIERLEQDIELLKNSLNAQSMPLSE